MVLSLIILNQLQAIFEVLFNYEFSELTGQLVERDLVRGRPEVEHVGRWRLLQPGCLHRGLHRGQIRDRRNSGRLDGEGRQHPGNCQDGGADHELI